MASIDYGYTSDTDALLVVGRVIEMTDLHGRHLEQLQTVVRSHAARTALPLGLVPAGDFSRATGLQLGPQDTVYCRLAIGVPAVVCRAGAAPAGPLSAEGLRTDLRSAEPALTDALWRDVAAVLHQVSLTHPAAVLRAGAPQIAAGVALDAAELLAGPNALHLMAAGPLAATDLVFGTPLPAPTDDEDDEDEEEEAANPATDICLFKPQDCHQEPGPVWVRGIRAAHANFAGWGTAVIDVSDEAEAGLRTRLGAVKGAAYYLAAYYD